MEYSASATKHLFWFVETKETAKLMAKCEPGEVREKIIEENLYQQKSRARLVNEFSCIRKRLEALPEELRSLLISADIKTGKLVNFIACMATDRLLFDLMYEVYRNKLFLGEGSITDADLNVFFKDKQEQNEKLASISDVSIKKLKQVYCKYMLEAGLLSGTAAERKVSKPYVDSELKAALAGNGMEKYIAVFTGQ